jgi:hypothetical protein
MVAIGYNTEVYNRSISIGYSAKTLSSYSIAIGYGAAASSTSISKAIAIGLNASAEKESSICIGVNSVASGQNNVAIGAYSYAKLESSVSIGRFAGGISPDLTGVGVVNIGNATTAIGNYDIALGFLSTSVQYGSRPYSVLSIGQGLAEELYKYRHIINVADPVFDQDAATKHYVDTTIGGDVANKANKIVYPHINWTPTNINVPAGRTIQFNTVRTPT